MKGSVPQYWELGSLHAKYRRMGGWFQVDGVGTQVWICEFGKGALLNLEELQGVAVGRYQLTLNFISDVKLMDGHLMIGIKNQPTQEVFADSPTKWPYRAVDATLEFHLRAEGPAYALTLHQNGAAQKAKRVSK